MIILTTNKILKITAKRFSIDYFKEFFKKKLVIHFLKQAKLIFLLDEYLKDDILRIGFKKINWIPDRCFEEVNLENKNLKEDIDFNILTPGGLYQGRNVDFDFVFEAYKKYNLNFEYKIVGMPKDDYGKKMVEKIRLLENKLPIHGIFEYLSDQDYKEIISKASFVLLPYSPERYDQVPAVMFDAFENDTPIIAPNVQPFNYYLSKYKLGFLYNHNELLSFIKVLEKASKVSKKSFSDNFLLFKKDFCYKKTQERVRIIIENLKN